jgi:6,7-dimethyl-8-ribityllumazine synthase
MASHLKNLSDFSHTTIPNGSAYKVAIIVAEWNAKITDALYQGAYHTLIKHGVKENQIISMPVPGTFELSGAAAIMLNKHADLDAVICLGCVIQGDTKHFDFICDAVANGITNARLKAQTLKVILILKNQYTFICLPTGEIFINSTGNSAMASGGMGDVLTGIIVALLAQNYPPAEAAKLGVYLHGKAGDELSKKFYTVTASQVAEQIPKTIKKILAERI